MALELDAITSRQVAKFNNDLQELVTPALQVADSTREGTSFHVAPGDVEKGLNDALHGLRPLLIKIDYQVPLWLEGRGTLRQDRASEYLDAAKENMHKVLGLASVAVRRYLEDVKGLLPASLGAVVLARESRRLEDTLRLIEDAARITDLLQQARDELADLA